MQIETKNLKLISQQREQVLEQIEAMSPAEKAQLSADWLKLLQLSTPDDYWWLGFSFVHRGSGIAIGTCGFKAAPTADGIVEIAYRVNPDQQGKGYATEATRALTAFALESGRVRVVRAHTLPEANASTRVLGKCGFEFVGEVSDPEDGLVWRWERIASRLEVVPFRAEFGSQVVELILEIQRNEFGMQITADEQPDLRQIETCYQVRNGNFWVALSDSKVVGTISLLDIGSSQGALRKMFVARKFRGRQHGTARRLLDTLIDWCAAHSIQDIFLGTTPHFVAAHRFYEKNGFDEIPKSTLPRSFPIMGVDTKFYRRRLSEGAATA